MAKQTSDIQLYYFWKDHCAPCKVARPIVEHLAKVLELNVTYLDVRSEEGERYITPFNLLAVPSLVIVKDGKLVVTLTGPDLQNEQKLSKVLSKHLDS